MSVVVSRSPQHLSYTLDPEPQSILCSLIFRLQRTNSNRSTPATAKLNLQLKFEILQCADLLHGGRVEAGGGPGQRVSTGRKYTEPILLPAGRVTTELHGDEGLLSVDLVDSDNRETQQVDSIRLKDPLFLLKPSWFFFEATRAEDDGKRLSSVRSSVPRRSTGVPE
ncbi:hypothetical protein INR49_008128 [Caranx melampygus]|nr:hypothetical protein INR49_008128 [Caranx melampygus]